MSVKSQGGEEEGLVVADKQEGVIHQKHEIIS